MLEIKLKLKKKENLWSIWNIIEKSSLEGDNIKIKTQNRKNQGHCAQTRGAL